MQNQPICSFGGGLVLSLVKIKMKLDIHNLICWLNIWNEPITPLVGIDLDEGKTACICLALQLSKLALLIIDGRAGRAVAKEKGLNIASIRLLNCR